PILQPLHRLIMALRDLSFNWSEVLLGCANTDREDDEYSKGSCKPGIEVHKIKSRVLSVVANSESAQWPGWSFGWNAH
ncbi:MAG: hypothetical protein DMF07_02910, partial [Verrucomicrobia bacterium]